MTITQKYYSLPVPKELYIFILFKPETELVVAWLRWSMDPLLVYMVFMPCDLYESPCDY